MNLADDLIWGADNIAAFIGVPVRRIYHWAEQFAAGVAARPDGGGWLVLPGDMPLVRPSSLVRVAQGLAQHAVTYAQYQGRRGHPVAFGAELFSELVQLRGDEGARRLMARYPSQGIELDDPGVLMDVDTLDDLAVVRASAAQAVQAAQATVQGPLGR